MAEKKHFQNQGRQPRLVSSLGKKEERRLKFERHDYRKCGQKLHWLSVPVPSMLASEAVQRLSLHLSVGIGRDKGVI